MIKDSFVLGGGSISDLVYPSAYIQNGEPSQILPTYLTNNSEEFKKSMLNKFKQKFLKIFLPMKIGENNKEYTFNFQIENLTFEDI